MTIAPSEFSNPQLDTHMCLYLICVTVGSEFNLQYKYFFLSLLFFSLSKICNIIIKMESHEENKTARKMDKDTYFLTLKRQVINPSKKTKFILFAKNIKCILMINDIFSR